MFDSASEFQRVQIVDSVPFGKTLVLDDHTQVCKFMCVCVCARASACVRGREDTLHRERHVHTTAKIKTDKRIPSFAGVHTIM